MDGQLGIKILSPENTRIFKGNLNMLQVIVDNDKEYKAVFAVAAFPVTNPTGYISLFYQGEKDKTYEIGIIEDINLFPEEIRSLVLSALKKYYFYYEILQIYAIKLEFGLLFFDVETDKGPKKFAMRWEYSKAVDNGATGKILTDVLEDRYVITDIDSLPHLDRTLFTRFIYW